jgi:NAD(P)-dependent dehydrogenase (short-subunit alcohol dehydrogenase family)
MKTPPARAANFLSQLLFFAFFNCSILPHVGSIILASSVRNVGQTIVQDLACAGVRQLIESLSKKLEPLGVRINGFGFCDTDERKIGSQEPILKRKLSPIIEVVQFLASSRVSGQFISLSMVVDIESNDRAPS